MQYAKVLVFVGGWAADVLIPQASCSDAQRSLTALKERSPETVAAVLLEYGACAQCLDYALSHVAQTPSVINMREQLR